LFSVHSRKLQTGADGPLDSKTGGQFQNLGVDKGPLVSKLEGNFLKTVMNDKGIKAQQDE
jgi:hypothetical protein